MTRPHPGLIALARSGRLLPLAESDEDLLLASALEHRMEGLLWSAIRDDSSRGSSDWRRDVAVHDLANRQVAAANWEGLRAIGELVNAMGVEVATVKGVTAETRWYERMGERPSGDVDLILSPNDVARAAELVAGIQQEHELLSDVQRLVDDQILQSIELRTPKGIAVDLHFDVFKLGTPARDPQRLWGHMQPFDGPFDSPILVPDGELALLHFLLHLTKDRFRSLLAHVDVQRVVTQEAIDWERFFALAESEGLGMHAALALQAVDDVLPLDYPEDGPHRSGATGVLWEYLWRPTVRLRGYEGVRRFRRRQDWLPVMMPGHRAEAIRSWLRRRVFPPPELQAYRSQSRGPRFWSLTGGRAAAAIRRRRDAGRRR
jgi:hypothetical protein